VQAEVRDFNFGARSLGRKSAYCILHIQPSFLPSEVNAAPNGRIYGEFDIGNFYENLPRSFKFGKNREKSLALYLKI